MVFSRVDGTGKSWCCLLRKLLAEPFALVLSSSSVHAPLLGLSTACGAVGCQASWWCASEGKQESELFGYGARSQARRCRTCIVAAMSVDSPLIRALGHDEEHRAFTTCVVQAAEEDPQGRVARRRKLQVCEHVTVSGEGAHVDVASQ